MNTFDERIEKFQNLIESSNRIVFFGGAGVSTESGIPDFRSKDGLYNQKDIRFDKYEPEYLLSRDCLMDNPKMFYEFYRQKMDCRNIEPNITHKKLAELENIGKLSAIITQNIDSLHQKAGSKNVYEIHGSANRVYCDFCHKEYDGDTIFESKEYIPKCECGGHLRPDVTLYGEALPNEAWKKSVNSLMNSDLFIVGGTSLTVYPANTLGMYYYGKDIVVINRDETSLDKYATITFRESLGKVFEQIKV